MCQASPGPSDDKHGWSWWQALDDTKAKLKALQRDFIFASHIPPLNPVRVKPANEKVDYPIRSSVCVCCVLDQTPSECL